MFSGATESSDGSYFGSAAPDVTWLNGTSVDFDAVDGSGSGYLSGKKAMDASLAQDTPNECLELSFSGCTKLWLSESIDAWRKDPPVADKITDPNAVVTVRLGKDGKR